MNSIKDFKDKIEGIEFELNEIKQYINSLNNNIYLSIIQINFSIKVIISLYAYINKYISSEQNVINSLNTSLINEQNGEDVGFSLYNLIGFNEEFITDVLYLENFSKMLLNAINDHLIINEDIISLENIYNNYCSKNNLINEWKTFSFFANSIVNDKGHIFSQNINHQGQHKRLLTEYNTYKKIIDSLTIIFNLETDELEQQSPLTEIEELIDMVSNIVNFRKSSPIYKNYLINLNNTIEYSLSILEQLNILLSQLIEESSKYEVNFSQENENIDKLITIVSNSKDLLLSLKVSYPTIDSMEQIFTDESFEVVINTIGNIYDDEIKSIESLLSNTLLDYKLIKSLESFLYKDSISKNSTLFEIMKIYDEEINEIENNLREINEMGFVPIKFLNLVNDNISEDSFVHKLKNLDILTEPYYDVFNYYRMFLYKLKNDKKYIFDMLETFHIFNKDIMKFEVDDFLEDFFNIRIRGIDFLNIDESKLNISITSKYKNLKKLDYFPIEKYIKGVEEIDLTEVDDYDKLFDYFNDIDNFRLIHFDITEKILYDKMDLDLVMKSFKKRTSYKDSLYLIFFGIVIDHTIKRIEAEYTEDDQLNIPIGNEKYEYLIKNRFNNWMDEIIYMKRLLLIKKIYEGKEDNNIFNLEKIEEFNDLNNTVWIDDLNKIELLKDLFDSFLREV